MAPRLRGFESRRTARSAPGAVAERSFRSYLRTLDTAQHISRYDARLRLADTHAQRRDLAAAEREATAAWDEIERWRATLSDRELRLLAFQAASSENQVSPASVSEQRASVARVLAGLATGGRAARAFELAEHRRARELGDRMARAQALRPQASTTPGAPPVSGPIAARSATDVAALIPDDSTAILEYVTGSLGAPTTLFVLTRGSSGGVGMRAHLLPPADSLAGQLTRFLALLQHGEVPGPLARAFGAALLDPAMAELRAGVTEAVRNVGFLRSFAADAHFVRPHTTLLSGEL